MSRFSQPLNLNNFSKLEAINIFYWICWLSDLCLRVLHDRQLNRSEWGWIGRELFGYLILMEVCVASFYPFFLFFPRHHHQMYYTIHNINNIYTRRRDVWKWKLEINWNIFFYFVMGCGFGVLLYRKHIKRVIVSTHLFFFCCCCCCWNCKIVQKWMLMCWNIFCSFLFGKIRLPMCIDMCEFRSTQRGELTRP